MSRFSTPTKPKNLTFDCSLYDVVRLSDNRLAIITDYGIYDNQYWCEIWYPDGVHLGAADYFSSNKNAYGTRIIRQEPEERQKVLNDYIRALIEYKDLYKEHIDLMRTELTK